VPLRLGGRRRGVFDASAGAGAEAGDSGGRAPRQVALDAGKPFEVFGPDGTRSARVTWAGTCEYRASCGTAERPAFGAPQPSEASPPPGRRFDPPPKPCPELFVVPDVPCGVVSRRLIGAAAIVGCVASAACASLSQTTTSVGTNAASAFPPRACPSSVGSAPPAGWHRGSLRAGTAWIYLWGAVADGGHHGLLAPSLFPARSRYDPTKTMVVVRAGPPVTLRVAPAHHVYGSRSNPAWRVSRSPADRPSRRSSPVRPARRTTTVVCWWRGRSARI
jgi:hypothetical protein